jgi:hypothetical protein
VVRVTDPVCRLVLLSGTYGCNSCTSTVQYDFNFWSSVRVWADEFETSAFVQNLWGGSSFPAPISSNLSFSSNHYICLIIFPVMGLTALIFLKLNKSFSIWSSNILIFRMESFYFCLVSSYRYLTSAFLSTTELWLSHRSSTITITAWG